MATDNFKEWDQNSIDSRIELEQRRMKESASKRAKRRFPSLARKPETVLRRRIKDSLKVAMITFVIGTLFLLVIHQFAIYFSGLIEFLIRVGRWIWSLI